MNPQTIIVVALILANCLAMFLFYRFLRSRFSQKRLLGELRSEVDRLIVDLGREADRDVAVLESRVQSLRSLIDEADRRILVAGKESARRQEEADVLRRIQEPTTTPAPRSADSTISLASKRPRDVIRVSEASGNPEVSLATDARSTKLSRATDRSPIATEADSSMNSGSSGLAGKGEPVRIYTRPRVVNAERKIEPFIPVQDRVIDMARQGFSPEMIAGNLSISLGEVELILDMNRSSL